VATFVSKAATARGLRRELVALPLEPAAERQASERAGAPEQHGRDHCSPRHAHYDGRSFQAPSRQLVPGNVRLNTPAGDW
jgi:hypothetical protein